MRVSASFRGGTHGTRRRLGFVALALLVLPALLLSLSACAVRSGGSEIAYLRGGQLWAIQPDGSNARQVASGSIASFAWAPRHNFLVFRAGSQALAAAVALPPEGARGVPEATSELSVVSINGGVPTIITPGIAGALRGDAWWNPQGNRLLYRERTPDGRSAYYISQNDQPVGIARKAVPGAASIPVVSADGERVAFVDSAGALRVGPRGGDAAIVTTGALAALPGTTRPARVLWRPRREELLYAAPSADGKAVDLVLFTLATRARRTVTRLPALLDVAFSPDGDRLLVRTPQGFEVWNIANSSVRTPSARWAEPDPYAVPWWAPDGRLLLVQSTLGWRTLDPQTGASDQLLARRTTTGGSGGAEGASPASWRPAVGSPWSPDGRAFTLIGVAGDRWRGAPLAAPGASAVGLYVADVAPGRYSQPRLLASGDVRSPGWSYVDPSTAFLVAA